MRSPILATATSATLLTLAFAQCVEEAVPVGWSTLETTGVPIARHEATFVMGGYQKAYLLGGRRVQPVSIYDVVTQSWSEKSSPPIELHHFQAVFAAGKIWIPAAWTGGFPNEKNSPDFYVYDPETDSWETRTPMPEGRRRGSAAVVYRDGKIYIAMGNIGGHGEQATTLGWLDIYDVETDSWSIGPDAPDPRDHTGGAVIGDGSKFCVAGGRDGGRTDFFNLNIAPTNCYNFESETWDVEAVMPVPRGGSSYGTTCGGKLMVAGGEGAGQAYSRVDVFDGSEWEEPSFLVRARHGSGLAIDDCECANIYIASGSGAQGGNPELTSTEVFSSDGNMC